MGKYLALCHLYGPSAARSILHHLEPNILPYGPPTQSISTYYIDIYKENSVYVIKYLDEHILNEISVQTAFSVYYSHKI